MYMDDMRILENIRKQESEEEEKARTFRVESTGYQLSRLGHIRGIY